MSIRSECIVVRDGAVLAYYDRHTYPVLNLGFGPESAVEFVDEYSGDGPDRTLLGGHMYDNGFLVDFDEQVVIAFGTPVVVPEVEPDVEFQALLDGGPSAYFAAIAPRFLGWTLRWDECGVDAFLWHLDRRRSTTPVEWLAAPAALITGRAAAYPSSARCRHQPGLLRRPETGAAGPTLPAAVYPPGLDALGYRPAPRTAPVRSSPDRPNASATTR